MTVFEMAMKYYPRFWDDRRIDALLQAGKLTQEEVSQIKNGKDSRHGL